MKPKTYYQAMAAYNQWMNKKLYALCDKLSDAERKKDIQTPFASIHGLFNHLLFGDRAWMKRFTGKEYLNKPVGQIIYEDYEEMKREHLALSEEMIRWAEKLDEKWLTSPFPFESVIYKRKRVLPAWLAVTHMFNHQTHHRGQLTAVLWKLGIDFGSTDLTFMDGLEDIEPLAP